MNHVLYTKKDKNIPDAILDRNGDVVLGMCKICRKAESELTEPCTNMQTTIKKQIKAVQRAYRDMGVFHCWDEKVNKKYRKDMPALNDAASTLTATAMMENQIKQLPALIKAAENICKFYHKENTWPVQELNIILNKLKS